MWVVPQGWFLGNQLVSNLWFVTAAASDAAALGTKDTVDALLVRSSMPLILLCSFVIR